MLIVSPEEAAQIRDGLPAGALRDHVAAAVTSDALIAKRIPELVVAWPVQRFSEEIYDEAVAQQVYRAVIDVLEHRSEPRSENRRRARR